MESSGRCFLRSWGLLIQVVFRISLLAASVEWAVQVIHSCTFVSALCVAVLTLTVWNNVQTRCVYQVLRGELLNVSQERHSNFSSKTCKYEDWENMFMLFFSKLIVWYFLANFLVVFLELCISLWFISVNLFFLIFFILMCACLPIKGYYSMSPCDDGYVSVYLYFLSHCLLSLSQSVFLFISQCAAIFPAF